MDISESINKVASEQMYIIKKDGYEEIYKTSEVTYDAVNDIILVNYRKFQIVPGQYTYYYSGIKTNEFIYHADQDGTFIKNDIIDWINIDHLNLSHLVDEF